MTTFRFVVITKFIYFCVIFIDILKVLCYAIYIQGIPNRLSHERSQFKLSSAMHTADYNIRHFEHSPHASPFCFIR